MIIKEFKKNLVILKGLNCDYIEEAFIILKGNLPRDVPKGDILQEANRIISEYRTGKKRKRLPFSLPSFFLGFGTASIIAIVLFILLL